MKQFDLRTKTLIKASGEPRPCSRHQSDAGSTTETLPSFFEHTGISADFSSRMSCADLANAGMDAAAIESNATTDSDFSPFDSMSLPPRARHHQSGGHTARPLSR